MKKHKIKVDSKVINKLKPFWKKYLDLADEFHGKSFKLENEEDIEKYIKWKKEKTEK